MKKHFDAKHALLLVVCMVTMSYTHADVMNDIAQGYKAASASWYGNLFAIAQGLFWKLAAIEFAWASIVWALRNQDMQSFTAALVQKMIGIGFFYALLLNASTWMPAIVNGLVRSGEIATGTSGLDPSSVFDLGINTAVAILEGIQDKGLLDDFATIVIAGIAALVVVLAFVIAAAQMLVALVESYIVLGGGVLFLGFGGSRWTTEFAQKYISYAFATGVKLFMIYLVIGVGMQQATTWAALLSTTDWNSLFVVMGASFMFAYLCLQIPAQASAMLSGSPALSAGGGAMAAGAIATGGVAAAASIMSPAMQSAKGGMQSLKSGYDHHRSNGHGMLSSGVMSVATSTVDMGREAGRTVGQSMGLAQPSASGKTSVGGRAADTRQNITAQGKEQQAIMGQAAQNVSPPGSNQSQSGPTNTNHAQFFGGQGTGGGSQSVASSAQGSSSSFASGNFGTDTNSFGSGATANSFFGGEAMGSGQQQSSDLKSRSSLGQQGQMATQSSGVSFPEMGNSVSGPSALNHGQGTQQMPGAPAVEMSKSAKEQSPPASNHLGKNISPENQKIEGKPLQNAMSIRPPHVPNDSAPPAGISIKFNHSDD